MSAPFHRYEVRIRAAGTKLLFAGLEAAHAEWLHRCREGQNVQLWQWLDETADEYAGWDCLLVAAEYEDVRSEQVRRYSTDESSDDHARDMAGPR